MSYTKGYTVSEATKKIERYCIYQERCHKEVADKLKSFGMIPQAIDHIISHLINENYLNEERFAKSFARGKFKTKKWGRKRIVNELRMRNISKFNIKAAMEEITDQEYMTVLDRIARKRIEQITESHPQKRKKKLADYLLYRGWESDLVYSKIKELV